VSLIVLVLVLDWNGKTIIGVMVLQVSPKSMGAVSTILGEKRPLEREQEHEHD
jgi:hypothetical protein